MKNFNPQSVIAQSLTLIGKCRLLHFNVMKQNKIIERKSNIMAASLTFELEQFPKGYFLAWSVSTQCWNTVNVTLKVGNTVYFSGSKNNHSTDLQIIHQSNRMHDCNGTAILTITVNEASTLKQSITSGAINDQRARKVGYVYDFCIEDSTDDDYNDVYVNIVGWAKKG